MRDDGPRGPRSGSVEAQSNSAVAAGVIGLGLANQIATDQGQAAVLADMPAEPDAGAEVKVADDAVQIPHPQPDEPPAEDLSTAPDPGFDPAALDVAHGSAPLADTAAAPGFAPPLGEPFHRPDLAATSLDAARPVAAPSPSPALSPAPIPSGHAAPTVSAAADAGRDPASEVPESLAQVSDATLTPVLGPVLGQDGILRPVTDLLQPVLGADGLVGNLVETVVQPILDPILGPDGLLDIVLGKDGVLAPVTGVLQPIIGEDGLVAQIVGSVTPVLNQILGQGGLLGPVSGILAPVLADDGVVGAVTDALSPVLDGVLTPVTGILAPVLAEDGVVGTVTDALGPVLDGVLTPVTGILAPVLADDGAVGTVTDALSPVLDGVLTPVTGILAPVLADDGVVGTVTDALSPVVDGVLTPVTGLVPALDTLETVAAPLVGDGGVLETLVGQNGLLGGLVGRLSGAGSLGHPAQPDTVEADFLDTLIGVGGPEDGGDAHGLPSIMDMLLSDAPPDLAQASDAGEDVLASLFDLPDLTGLLVETGVTGADAISADHGFEPDADIDTLLNEILDSAERPLAGVADPVDALLDFGADAAGGGFFADAAVENALGVIFGEARADAQESAGGLLDALTEMTSADDQP